MGTPDYSELTPYSWWSNDDDDEPSRRAVNERRRKDAVPAGSPVPGCCCGRDAVEDDVIPEKWC